MPQPHLILLLSITVTKVLEQVMDSELPMVHKIFSSFRLVMCLMGLLVVE